MWKQSEKRLEKSKKGVGKGWFQPENDVLMSSDEDVPAPSPSIGRCATRCPLPRRYSAARRASVGWQGPACRDRTDRQGFYLVITPSVPTELCIENYTVWRVRVACRAT